MGTPQPSIASTSVQQEILAAEYPHARLVVPKLADDDVPRVTFSKAVMGRATPGLSLEYRPTPKNQEAELQNVGLENLHTAQATRRISGRRGLFSPMESMGMTVAYFGSESDEETARDALGDEYEFVNDFSLSLPPRRVELEDSPATRGLAALAQREFPAQSGVSVAHERGIRGAGVLVGVLDTGVDADHQEFQHQTVTYRFVSFFPTSPFWPPRDVRGFDTDGHGTHVSGIIAGNHVGVAPESDLYVASVIESETTRTSMTRVVSGLDWLLRQFSRPENENLPAILNMSLGFPSARPPGISQAEYLMRLRVMRSLLRVLIQANVLPVCAIGNDGVGQFGFPGAFVDVVGVGAVNFEGQVASFSGSGSFNGTAKPDIVGYGVGVHSSVERTYDGDSVYQRFNGTSMASPYVSGIAALYRCHRPTLTVEDTKGRLISNALGLPNENASRIGAGLARFVP